MDLSPCGSNKSHISKARASSVEDSASLGFFLSVVRRSLGIMGRTVY